MTTDSPKSVLLVLVPYPGVFLLRTRSYPVGKSVNLDGLSSDL